MHSRIALIGLGNMGLPMAKRLQDAGHHVRTFDVSPDARSRAISQGIEVAGSPVDAVRDAEQVILMLPNSQIIEQVLAEDDLLSELPQGCIIIDMSSSSPVSTKLLADSARRHGVRFVDAPVSGGVRGAVDGMLTIMVGGDDEDVLAVEPTLAVLGKSVQHVGPVSAGHAVKALNNLMSAGHLFLASEALSTAQRFGLDVTTVLNVVNGSSGRSGSTENKWPNFVMTGGFDSGFGLQLMLKDMKIAQEIARDTGAPFTLSDQLIDAWQEAVNTLPSGADHTEIAQWIMNYYDATPSEEKK